MRIFPKALLDFRNYYPYINLPKDLIEGYIVIDKNGFSVLSMPRNYVVNDFSQGIMVFAGCNTDPRTIYPEMANGSLSYDALMMNYYAYELYCDDYSYRDFTFVDRSGRIIASGFDDAYGFYEDYAAVKKNGKWGYIDKNGDLVVDFIFDKATAISDGSAWVIYKGKTGRLNIGGLLNNGVVIDDEVLTKEAVTIE